jgi:hypothetical protein
MMQHAALATCSAHSRGKTSIRRRRADRCTSCSALTASSSPTSPTAAGYSTCYRLTVLRRPAFKPCGACQKLVQWLVLSVDTQLQGVKRTEELEQLLQPHTIYDGIAVVACSRAASVALRYGLRTSRIRHYRGTCGKHLQLDLFNLVQYATL